MIVLDVGYEICTFKLITGLILFFLHLTFNVLKGYKVIAF